MHSTQQLMIIDLLIASLTLYPLIAPPRLHEIVSDYLDISDGF